jgi:hypothetical protein
MLGKAVYEGVLLELPLAGFFLKKFSGQRCDLCDLASLDPEVHRHLLALRHYKGAWAGAGFGRGAHGRQERTAAAGGTQWAPGSSQRAAAARLLLHHAHQALPWPLNVTRATPHPLPPAPPPPQATLPTSP